MDGPSHGFSINYVLLSFAIVLILVPYREIGRKCVPNGWQALGHMSLLLLINLGLAASLRQITVSNIPLNTNWYSDKSSTQCLVL